ncbi:uncharacterized protein A4U43_C01F34950 [Asparagus officinalis]|uniref:Uncharacterized protein n=1 Tax=Asparagus officinalis TaxID=4686 RepID=A0A5P1FWH1_ASPOF|nr:uncharacterized protein A4U43_C01F34950 [Asparagus officinalis]
MLLIIWEELHPSLRLASQRLVHRSEDSVGVGPLLKTLLEGVAVTDKQLKEPGYMLYDRVLRPADRRTHRGLEPTTDRFIVVMVMLLVCVPISGSPNFLSKNVREISLICGEADSIVLRIKSTCRQRTKSVKGLESLKPAQRNAQRKDCITKFFEKAVKNSVLMLLVLLPSESIVLFAAALLELVTQVCIVLFFHEKQYCSSAPYSLCLFI